MAGSWFPGISPSRVEPAGIDISVAHPARIYDYVLGGKDNFAADRDAAQAAMAANPHLGDRDAGKPCADAPDGRRPGPRARRPAVP